MQRSQPTENIEVEVANLVNECFSGKVTKKFPFNNQLNISCFKVTPKTLQDAKMVKKFTQHLLRF